MKEALENESAYQTRQRQRDTVEIGNLLMQQNVTLYSVHSVTGVLYFSYNNWIIEPKTSADVVSGTGISNADAGTEIKSYPNPVTSVLHLRNVHFAEKAEVCNVLGQK